jgi:hypothetical protein
LLTEPQQVRFGCAGGYRLGVTDPRRPPSRPPLQYRMWWLQAVIGVGLLVVAVGWATTRERDDRLVLAIVWSLLGLTQLGMGLYNRRQGQLAEAGRAGPRLAGPGLRRSIRRR